MGVDVRALTANDVRAIIGIRGGNGWNPDPCLWTQYLAEQADGTRIALVAWDGPNPVGYGTLLLRSGHAPFAAVGIPEINNLSTALAHRGRGVARAVIQALEAEAAKTGATKVGIGVGLYADYGPAQRLYARLGYVPDGSGITYGGRRVEPGERVRVDDELVLWLAKPIRALA